jgi:hypothetical protein
MFRIPEDNLEGLLAALDKVRRKAEKLHSGAITWVVYTTQPEVVKSKDSHGIERVRTWFPVEVVGPQPKIHGWTFVATLEHLENGNLVRGVEGLVTEGELTQFRQMTSACDHCKQKRNRIDTFVLRSDQGEYMQLGRNCLRDFFGHENPEAVAAMWECLFNAQQEGRHGEGEGWSGGAASPLSIECFLNYTAAVIRRLGFVSRKRAEETNAVTTAAQVGNVVFDNEKHGVHGDGGWCCYSTQQNRECEWNRLGGHIGITDADEAKATAALAWIRGMDGFGLSDYLYNVWLASQESAVPGRRYGIVASLLAAYQRELTAGDERKAKEVEFPDSNQWIGVEGERIRLNLTVKHTQAIEGNYGVTILHTFVDAAGHRMKWFSSGASFAEGDVVDVMATIKGHGEYQGFKITNLTRVADYKPPKGKKVK